MGLKYLLKSELCIFHESYPFDKSLRIWDGVKVKYNEF